MAQKDEIVTGSFAAAVPPEGPPECDTSCRSIEERFAIDFSYELPFAGRDGRARRFRGTIYHDVDHIALNLRVITDEVRALPDARFDEPVPGRDYTLGAMMKGVVEHDTYHGGQIAILKKQP